MIDSESQVLRARLHLITLLMAIAGAGVDAAVILGFEVLTGAQTGNTILLATAFAQGRFGIAASAMISVAAYVAGAALGEFLIVRHRGSCPWLSGIATAVMAEMITLSSLLVIWYVREPHPGFVTTSVLIADAASAMGLQSAVMLRLHGGPTTTYITGNLTTFATNLVQWLDLVERASTREAGRNANVRTRLWATDGPWVYGLTWFIYVSAAIVVGFLFLHIGEFALLVPIFAVLVVFVVARGETVAAAVIS